MRGDESDAEFHESRAAKLLATDRGHGESQDDYDERRSQLAAVAQAHATLALSLRQADHTKALRAVTHRGAVLTHQRGT